MNADVSITVKNLAEVPHLAPTLEGWYVREWMPWYGPQGEGDAAQDLAACVSGDRLPVCLAALNEEHELLGTAALRETSVGSDIAPGPWLAALLVGEEARRRGVGNALIAAIEAEARRLGFEELYVSTDTAMNLVGRRGWLPVGEAPSLRGETIVYRCIL